MQKLSCSYILALLIIHPNRWGFTQELLNFWLNPIWLTKFQILGKFIARGVADDCLPPAFVNNYTEDTGEESLQRKALSRADVLLKMKHGMVRLDNVWGVGGGRRPVKQLIKKMVLLLKEYLSSQDIEEVIRFFLSTVFYSRLFKDLC